MRWKLMVLPVMALFSMTAALTARAQVTYSAEEGKLPFTVGAESSTPGDAMTKKLTRMESHSSLRMLVMGAV